MAKCLRILPDRESQDSGSWERVYLSHDYSGIPSLFYVKCE